MVWFCQTIDACSSCLLFTMSVLRKLQERGMRKEKEFNQDWLQTGLGLGGHSTLSPSVCQGSGPTGCREEPSLSLSDRPQMWPLPPQKGLGGSFLHDLCMSGHQVLSRKQRISPRNKTKLLCGLPNSLMEELKLYQVTHFVVFLHRLIGDILLCTGFLSYLGPFNQIFRNLLLKDQWETELRARKIPFTENLNLISMLVDPPTVSVTFLLTLFEFQSRFISYLQRNQGTPNLFLFCFSFN